jgi:hypothetical protein
MYLVFVQEPSLAGWKEQMRWQVTWNSWVISKNTWQVTGWCLTPELIDLRGVADDMASFLRHVVGVAKQVSA